MFGNEPQLSRCVFGRGNGRYANTGNAVMTERECPQPLNVRKSCARYDKSVKTLAGVARSPIDFISIGIKGLDRIDALLGGVTIYSADADLLIIGSCDAQCESKARSTGCDEETQPHMPPCAFIIANPTM